MSSGGFGIRVAAGAVWLFMLGALLAGEDAGPIGVFLWTVPAAGVWIALLRREAAGRPRPHGGVWALVSLTGPFTLLMLLTRARTTAPQTRVDEPSQRPTTEADVTTDELLIRLARVEDRMGALQAEVDSIRVAVRTRTAPVVATPAPAPAPRQAPAQAAATPPWPAAPTEPPVAAPPPPPPPREPRREFDLATLFGPQALAWTGGVVT